MKTIKEYILTHRYFMLSIFVTLLAIANAIFGKFGFDFWEHTAVIRELAANPLSPGHPLYLMKAPHVFYSPYALVVALISRITHASPIRVLPIVGIFNVIILVIFFRKFVIKLIPTENGPFYALLLVLISWGPFPWWYSGFIHLQYLPGLSPYPSTFSIAISFLALSIYMGLFDKWTAVNYSFMIILTTIALLSHPIVGIFLVIGIISLTINMGQRSILSYLMGLGVIGMAFLLVFLWPYYPFLKLINISGFNASLFDASNHTMYEKVFSITFPAWVGIPIIIGRIRRNKKDFLGLMFLILLVIYIYGGLSGKYSYGRVISFIIIILDIAIADVLARIELGEILAIDSTIRKKIRYLVIGVFIILFIFHTATHAIRFWKQAHGSGEYIEKEYSFLGNYTKQNEVILSDLSTSYIIPTFGGKVVASGRPILFVNENETRMQDVLKFFSVKCSVSERIQILQKYHCNYILLNKVVLGNNLMDDQSLSCRLGDIIFENSQFKLIKVNDLNQ
jgi:hypothetical protein